STLLRTTCQPLGSAFKPWCCSGFMPLPSDRLALKQKARLPECLGCGLVPNAMCPALAADELLRPHKPFASKSGNPQNPPGPSHRGAIRSRLRFVGRVHRNKPVIPFFANSKNFSSRSDKPRSALCQSKNATYENFLLFYS